MSELLIVQNITREGPGILEQVLKDGNVTYDVVDLDQGQVLPRLDKYKALVVLGGPDSANDETDKITSELSQIKKALDSGMPYLGICLGLQILVKAAGGKVVPGEVKETGFINLGGNQHTVTLTDEGRSDPLFDGLPDKLNVFQLHGETVDDLTPDMTVLATGEFCRNQIVRVGERAYGIQSHFELTRDMLRVWAEQDPDLAPIGKDKLMAGFKNVEAEEPSYTQIGRALFQNFLRIAGLAK